MIQFLYFLLDISTNGNFHALHHPTAYASEGIQLIPQTYFTSLLLTLFQHLLLWCYKTTWQWCSTGICIPVVLTTMIAHMHFLPVLQTISDMGKDEGWSQPSPRPKDLIEWWWWVENCTQHLVFAVIGDLCNSSFPEWIYLVLYLKSLFRS